MNITIEFFIFDQIWRNQCIKFKPKLTIFNFWVKLALKGCFQPKRKDFKHQITLKVTLKKYKPNGEIEFRPFYFNSATKTVINHKFSLDKSFQEIVSTCKKRSLKQKKEHHHRILHNHIILGSKFQLQHTILIFWNKFPIKRSIVKR